MKTSVTFRLFFGIYKTWRRYWHTPQIIWEELYREEFRTILIKHQMNTICLRKDELFTVLYPKKTAFWLVTGKQEFYRLFKRLWAWSLFVFPFVRPVHKNRLFIQWFAESDIEYNNFQWVYFSTEPFRWIITCHRRKSLYRRWKWRLQSTFDMINRELGDAEIVSLRSMLFWAAPIWARPTKLRQFSLNNLICSSQIENPNFFYILSL